MDIGLVKCVSSTYFEDHVAFDFSLVNVVYDIDWFVCIEPFLWIWDESHLVVVYDLFYILLDLVG